MRFLLTLLLPFHWLVVFASLAILAASGPRGLEQVAAALGVTGPTPLVGEATAAVLAVVFALAAVLFLWSLLTTLLADGEFPGPADEVSGIAFGTAIGTTTALLLVAVAAPVTGLFAAVALQVTALAASFAAIHAERRTAPLSTVGEGSDIRAAARLMAAGAAHSSMLTRLSGRGQEGGM